MSEIAKRLNAFYKKPLSDSKYSILEKNFCCPNYSSCVRACEKKAGRTVVFRSSLERMSNERAPWEDKSYRGLYIPRVVVVSLSKPKPASPEPKSTSSSGSPRGRNTHWPGTLSMVRSFLHVFLGKSAPQSVESCFIHLRSAKCSSDANGGGQEAGKVYANCSQFMRGELEILQPDVLITQGVTAERSMWKSIDKGEGVGTYQGRFFKDRFPPRIPSKVAKNPKITAKIIRIDGKLSYWLPCYFPTNRGGGKRYKEQAGKQLETSSGEKWIWESMCENFVAYAEDMKAFLKSEGRWGVKNS